MIESLHVQINRLRELYDSQGLIERDFHQAQLEDIRPTYYFGQHQQPTITSSSHSHSHILPHASVPATAPTGYHRANESFSLLQRELSNERETLQRTQEELDEERRLSRTQRELANELQLHVKELER
jgi:hypothetical protein